MSAAGYLALIDRLSTVRPPVYVFGGYAEDAVLAGQTTRPHGDVDVLVGRVDLAEHLQRFAEWGSLRGAVRGRAWQPARLSREFDGIELELGVFDALVPGRPSFVLPEDDHLTRVTLPADSLTHPVARIDGVPIRTISPLALHQLRAAVMRTGVFGPPRPKDVAAQALLRSTLLADLPADELGPEFGPYLP